MLDDGTTPAGEAYDLVVQSGPKIQVKCAFKTRQAPRTRLGADCHRKRADSVNLSQKAPIESRFPVGILQNPFTSNA